MARRVIESFHISIKGQTDDYEIEAIGPRDVKVDPQPFRWNPSPGLITINERLSNGENVNHSEIKQIGQALYDALFITPIAKAYGKSEAHLKGDEGIRILLHVEPRELAALPWEAMHDGRDFISGRSEDPLVRSYPIEVDKPVKKLQVRGALRVLFVGASPTGLPGLKLEEAAEQIRKLLEEPINKKRVVLDVLLNASLEDLRSKLLEDFHILPGTEIKPTSFWMTEREETIRILRRGSPEIRSLFPPKNWPEN
jgi:hypothetical protein